MPTPRQAGQLDRRITILRASTTKNSFNEDVEAWDSLGSFNAAKEDLGGGEGDRAGEIAAQATTRFHVRMSPATVVIDARDRIAFAGREYNIVSIDDVGRNQFRRIDAVARSDGG